MYSKTKKWFLYCRNFSFKVSIHLGLGLLFIFIGPTPEVLAKSELQIKADRYNRIHGIKTNKSNQNKRTKKSGQINNRSKITYSSRVSNEKAYSVNIADANSATELMVDALENNLDDNNFDDNSLNENSIEKPELDFDMENYITNSIKNIQGPDNDIAMHLFSLSVRAIKAVFPDNKLTQNRDNLVQTIKQVACIFVAETRYGNLSKKYDKCDHTNLGQIRPPAYKAIFDQCESDFTNEQLRFLGTGTTCKTLHPYEMPFCCEAKKDGEAKTNCDQYHNNPRVCIAKVKRDYLEETNQANELEQISCLNTSGETYWRVPAVPAHSVFAAVYYLRIRDYHKMSDSEFTRFGALRYNAAGGSEQAGYQRKLQTCLNVLNRNDDLIRSALLNVEAPKE